MKGLYFLAAILALSLSSALGHDPSPVQDFCVALDDPLHGVFVNGKFCKHPKKVVADDFFFTGLNMAGSFTDRYKANITTVNVKQLPGLNTLGISMVRIDYAPGGLHPPHTHPRATAMLTVLEGTLSVGFVSSADDGYRLFKKILHPGDVFVFPVGLIHYQYNIGNQSAAALVAFDSQNPGDVYIGESLFGSHPEIETEILAKTLQLDKKKIEDLKNKF